MDVGKGERGMTVNRKPTGTASSIPAGLGWGCASATAVMLMGTFVTAKMIDKEILGWNRSGYAIMVILLLSSWVGAMMASGRIKRRRLTICMAAGAVYMIMLMLMTALFFGGQYNGVGETGLLILCGSTLAAFSQPKKRNGRIKAKIRSYNR